MAREARSEGDPLKMYIIVMSLLVVVMFILFLVIDNKRKEFVKGNQRAETYMTGRGLAPTMDDTPRTIPELALAVERLAYTTKEASGGGGLEPHISTEYMEKVATAAGLRLKRASSERSWPNRADKYETISMKFDYQSAAGEDLMEVWRVLQLLFFVEARGRYRVSEVSWTAADANEDPEPPFDKVKSVQIEVSLRLPMLDTQ